MNSTQASTVEDVLSKCPIISRAGHEPLLRWYVDGGCIAISISDLRRALEDAYDPSIVSWPFTAMID